MFPKMQIYSLYFLEWYFDKKTTEFGLIQRLHFPRDIMAIDRNRRFPNTKVM